MREEEREDAYLDIALPTGEMKREVQSELEWFTENEACSEIAFFWGHFRKKKVERKKINSRARLTDTSIPLSGTEGGASGRLASEKSTAASKNLFK